MIRESLSLLESIRDAGNPKIIVGVSGKDSRCVFDLCYQVFGAGNVFAFFLYLIPDLDCERQAVEFIENKYGVVVHKLRHPDMAHYLRQSWLNDRRPEIEDLIRRNLTWADIEAIMRSRTGARWFAYGHRITDSPQRRAMILRHRGVIEKRRVCYPIWDWKPRDAVSFLRAKNIPIPPMFGSRIDRTSGLAPHSVECLLFLMKNYPRDYQRVVEVFPQCENLIYRDEVRAKYAVEQNSQPDEAESVEVA